MADENLSQQIETLRGMLTSIDGRLTKAGSAPEGLEDLKRAVDSLRTSVWAILSASRSSNYHVQLERFRLRRAIDGARSIMAEMDNGTLKGYHPEHDELQIVYQQMVERIGHLKR